MYIFKIAGNDLWVKAEYWWFMATFFTGVANVVIFFYV